MAKVFDVFELPFLSASDFIIACIDIEEPIWIEAGMNKDVGFRYRAGNPRSTAFYIWWFFSEADALENRLDPDTYALPITTISPAAPEPDTGYRQRGIVNIQVPETKDKTVG